LEGVQNSGDAIVSNEWKPITSAPQDGTVIRCKNSQMDFTVLGKWGQWKSPYTGKLSMEWIIVLDEDDFPTLRYGQCFVPTLWQYVSDPD
jgi:hypothetical protein